MFCICKNIEGVVMSREIFNALDELERILSESKIKELDKESVKYIANIDRYRKEEDSIRAKLVSLTKILPEEHKLQIDRFLRIIDSNKLIVNREVVRRKDSKFQKFFQVCNTKFSMNYNRVPFFQAIYHSFKSIGSKPVLSMFFYFISTVVALVGAFVNKIDSFLFDEGGRMIMNDNYKASWKKHTFGMQWSRGLYQWSTGESKNFIVSGIKKLIAWPLLIPIAVFEVFQITKLVVRLATTALKAVGTVLSVVNEYTFKSLANYISNKASSDDTSKQLSSQVSSIRRGSAKSISVDNSVTREQKFEKKEEIEFSQKASNDSKHEVAPLIQEKSNHSAKRTTNYLLLGSAVAACALSGGAIASVAVVAKLAIAFKAKMAIDAAAAVAAGAVGSKFTFFKKQQPENLNSNQVDLQNAPEEEPSSSPSLS
jgi:hypothetical protein